MFSFPPPPYFHRGFRVTPYASLRRPGWEPPTCMRRHITYDVPEVGVAERGRVGHDRARAVRLVVAEQRRVRHVAGGRGQRVADVVARQRPELVRARGHAARPVSLGAAGRLRPVRHSVRVAAVIVRRRPVVAALLHHHLPQPGDNFVLEVEQPAPHASPTLQQRYDIPPTALRESRFRVTARRRSSETPRAQPEAIFNGSWNPFVLCGPREKGRIPILFK